MAEHPGAFGRSGAGRVNIIHDKHLAASDLRGRPDGKGAAQAGAALMAGEANLRTRISDAQEEMRNKLPAIARRPKLQRRSCDQFRLIESVLAPLRLVQRHWDDQDGRLFERRRLDRQLLHRLRFKGELSRSHRLSQHPSQQLCCRTHAVELEPMNQFAQPTFVTAIGHGMGKGTSDAPAHRTSPQTILICFRAGRKHPVPADRANLAADRKDAEQAIEANPQPGNIQQRLAANAAAIRRE
jgi:hypothetical protein